MPLRLLIPAIALVAICTSVASAQRDLKDVPDPDPEQERKTFILPDGFEVNLFAADPQIAKPIHMNFDERGRLWIAASSVYPQVKPGETPNDKILILEDRNGDGVSDQTTVFADGLLIPTGVAPGDGGAYVANSTELLHLKDTNGDGRADERRTVLSGFGTEDTHHILHTLRWGPDGMLYMNQSIYIHSHIETPYGPRRLDAGGIWHFRPDTMQLDVFARGFVNPWGHAFDYWGQSFATDGAYGEGINYVFPGATFVTAKDAPRILRGLNPGSPKHCGLEIINGRHFPDDWQGSMVTSDFRAHRVCRFCITEDRSGYSSRQEVEVVKSAHPAFRPVDAKIGPDGALYIADWYNPIIQHGEVDFRDPRRDHVHGRIWRVTAKGRPLVTPPKFAEMSVEQILDTLKLPEDNTRLYAKRELKARGQAHGQASDRAGASSAAQIADAVDRWLAGLDPHDARYDHHRLEALWTYQTLNLVRPALVKQLLASRDHRVRAAAVRAVYHQHAQIAEALALLEAAVADPHPRVRLEAVRLASQLKSYRAAELALRVVDQPLDEWLDFALWQTMRDLQEFWLPAVQAGKANFGGRAAHLAFALKAVGSPQIVGPLMALLASGKVADENQESLLVLAATLGGPAELRQMLDLALVDKTPARRRVLLLEALARAARERKARPQGDLAGVGRLLAASNAEPLRIAAARLAGACEVRSAAPQLLEIAISPTTAAALRAACFDALATTATVAQLRELSPLVRSTEVRQLAPVAHIARDVRAGATAAAALLTDATVAMKQPDDARELFAAILARAGGTKSLVAALAGKNLSSDVAKLGLRAIDAAGRPEAELTAVLRAAGGLAATRTYSAEDYKRLAAEVAASGDPARGERVFRNRANNCQKCHAIAGAGGSVGPDLVSLGGSAPVDYILESLLEPSKKIKENYHSLVVQDDSGQIITGIKLRETPTDLILRDAEDREISIPLGTIENRKDGASLMPSGAVEPLTHRELIDLARFLSELGKVGPYAVGKAPVVRRWQTLAASEASHTLLNRNSLDVAATSADLAWEPVYSTVAGGLPLEGLPVHEPHAGQGRYAIVRFVVEAKAAATTLAWNDIAGLQIWIDGKPTPVAATQRIALAPGKHTVTLAADLGKRSAEIGCTVE
jgi:putative heme-binding domain-containing protein